MFESRASETMNFGQEQSLEVSCHLLMLTAIGCAKISRTLAEMACLHGIESSLEEKFGEETLFCKNLKLILECLKDCKHFRY